MFQKKTNELLLKSNHFKSNNRNSDFKKSINEELIRYFNNENDVCMYTIRRDTSNYKTVCL